jgi:hypothetical protein
MGVGYFFFFFFERLLNILLSNKENTRAIQKKDSCPQNTENTLKRRKNTNKPLVSSALCSIGRRLEAPRPLAGDDAKAPADRS